MVPKDEITRRDLLAPAAAGVALTLVPRHVLGGPGYVAPSDKITHRLHRLRYPGNA